MDQQRAEELVRDMIRRGEFDHIRAEMGGLGDDDDQRRGHGYGYRGRGRGQPRQGDRDRSRDRVDIQLEIYPLLMVKVIQCPILT